MTKNHEYLRKREFSTNLHLLTVCALVLVCTESYAQFQQLNDTGVTTCLSYYAFVDCSRSTDDQGSLVLPGQDGHYGRDVTHNDDSDGRAGFSFTKIDASGKPLPASATSWDCVLDNVTGHMWEVKTDDGGLRDRNHTYTSYNSDWQTNGGNPGFPNGGTCYDTTNCDTEKYVAKVNAGGLCGHNDWQIPGREVLRSIVDYSVLYPGPTIDMEWFPNTLGVAYWSASPDTYDASATWYIYFSRGLDRTDYDNFARWVRLVRGDQ